MQDKKSIKLTIIGLAVLFALILGATYAYLQAIITNDNSQTLILGKTDKLGTVTLSNPTSDLKLKVTAKDMLKNKLGIYYATTDETLNYDADEIQRNVAVATLFGGESSLNYKCSMTVNIVTEGTMLSFLDEGDIYVQFGGLLTNKVDLTNISSEGYTVDFNLNNTYLPEQYVSASVALVNKNTNQNDLAGKSLAISFQNTNFSCEVIEATNETVNTSNSVIALQNSYGMDLMDYKIYGNSIQNGTPTPTNPVEVESVGDRTNNLFDFANLILKGNATTTKNSVTLPDNSTTYTTQEMLINADSNTTYTLYGIIETKNSSGHIAIDCLDENKTTIKTNIIVYNAEDNKKFKTITTPANTKYLRVNLRNRTTDGFTMKDIMIAKGSVSHFEPIGYKIPIISKGKNLLDYKWFLQEGNEWISGSYHRRYIQLKPNTTYTIKSYIPEDADPKPGLFVANYVEAYDVPQANGHWATTTGTREATFTTDSTGLIIIKRIINWQVTDQTIIDFFNTPGVEIQLEEGSVATEYEPYVEPITTNIYLDEPLRKVGTTSDYIDFANKNVVRNINVLNINDYNTSGLIYHYEWQGKKSLYFPNVLDNSYTRIPGLSNRNSVFTADANAASSMWIGAGSANLFWLGIYDVLGFTDDETSTARDKFQTWLAQNPTYVYHATTSPTTVPINLPNIPTFAGSTIIEVGASIKPNNVDITYSVNISK